MDNFTAEASSQARGYTRCGSELIVNEIATGSSSISHQDAFQVALKLAQQKADTTLKEELMKIDMGNEPCKMLRGRDGLPGNRGKRGAKGDKGDSGTFPFRLPSQFLNGNTFVIPATQLTYEQKEMLDEMIGSLRSSNDCKAFEYVYPRADALIATPDLTALQEQFARILKRVYAPDSNTTVDLSQTYEPFTTIYNVLEEDLVTLIYDFLMYICDYYPRQVTFLSIVKKVSASTDTAAAEAAAIGEVGTDALAAAEGDSVTFTYIISFAAILSFTTWGPKNS